MARAVAPGAKSSEGLAFMSEIKTVGVIGAGQMGAGIAHVVALGGYGVRLHDVSRERIDAGIAGIEKNMARQVGRGIIDDAAMKAALARIQPAEGLEAIGATDLAI
jgi:3-hydroxybutyryl-CoA dehydrogenase